MGRRDEYDDEDEIKSPRGDLKRGGVPPGVWVLLGVAGVGAVMLFGALALTAGRQAETRPTQTEPANKLYTRDEFRKLLVGKTADEVLQAVGKPDSTSETALGAYWYYRHKTTDPVTGQTDANAQVCFSNGQVVRINY
jgi:outer membrane protein assembly factor BamE (lipoprotein component of BamABCDE complex)